MVKEKRERKKGDSVRNDWEHTHVLEGIEQLENSSS
jgi:hypothetical protein